MRRPHGKAALATLALAAGAAACGGGGGSLHSAGPELGWAPGEAVAANGTPPSYTATGVCGSDSATFLSELASGNPLQAKVPYEWGDIVAGGKQVLVSGTVAATHLGPTDNPFTHAFGDDLSMDVKLDSPFLPFTKQLGHPDEPEGQMHVEISSGLIPHEPRASQASAGQTWRQLSDFNLTGFQPGFSEPGHADRVLVMGRWIIDCGHPNYGTELHPMSFLAWTQHSGSTTVARAYVNGYRDTQLYSPDLAASGKVSDTARLSGAQPFPAYFVSEVARALNGTVDHLSANELVEATHPAPAPWVVCAPPGATGSSLQVHYDVVTRPGVTVTVRPQASSGCAQVSVALGSGYTPADATVRQCVVPWPYLTEIAQQTYGTTLDIKGVIDRFVTSPAGQAIVGRDPGTSCADALAGPQVSPSPTGQHLRVDASQPFPFYGVVTVTLR